MRMGVCRLAGQVESQFNSLSSSFIQDWNGFLICQGPPFPPSTCLLFPPGISIFLQSCLFLPSFAFPFIILSFFPSILQPEWPTIITRTYSKEYSEDYEPDDNEWEHLGRSHGHKGRL